MNTPNHVNLAICVPSQEHWKTDFGYSFAQMCVYLGSALFEEGQSREAQFIDKRTSNLPRSRQESLEDALLRGCTHALFLDTDQVFPMDTPHRLLRWKKPVVACNIPLKTLPSFPTARQRGPTAFGVPVYSNSTSNPMGLEKVWRVGSGIMMIDLSIMPAIPKPWFELRYSDKHQQFVGEDWYFCKKVEDAGHDIYIDHDLSRHIAHVGNLQYSHAMIPQMPMEAAA